VVCDISSGVRSGLVEEGGSAGMGEEGKACVVGGCGVKGGGEGGCRVAWKLVGSMEGGVLLCLGKVWRGCKIGGGGGEGGISEKGGVGGS